MIDDLDSMPDSSGMDPASPEFWMIDPKNGVMATPQSLHQSIIELQQQVQALLEQVTFLMNGPDAPAALFETWLRETFAPTYYYSDDDVSEILGNTALRKEFGALHIMWQSAYQSRSGPIARQTWHDALHRVRQRYSEWVAAKRAWRTAS